MKPFDPKFIIDIIGTYGLAVLLVLYFVFFRDRKMLTKIHNNYDRLKETCDNHYGLLAKDYGDLNENFKELQYDYNELINSIRPETVKMTKQQALKLNDIALDRDLYKIYYRMCQKIDSLGETDLQEEEQQQQQQQQEQQNQNISIFLKESILDTNETWNEFRPPFRNPNIYALTNLYDMYSNSGTRLGKELEKILNSKQKKNQKKGQTFKLLLTAVMDMKQYFREALIKEERGETITPYWWQPPPPPT